MCLICCIPRKVYDLLMRGKMKKRSRRKKVGGTKEESLTFLKMQHLILNLYVSLFFLTDILDRLVFQGLHARSIDNLDKYNSLACEIYLNTLLK